MDHEHAITPETHRESVRRLIGERRVVALTPASAQGKRLAAAVINPVDSPAFDNSQMDGYALSKVQCRGGTFGVGPTIAAGTDPASLLPDGIGEEIIPVMTGSRLPARTSAVVPVEKCEPGTFGASNVTVPVTWEGQFVRLRGSDLSAGAELFSPGHLVGPRTIGAAALQGVTRLSVVAPVRVLLVTGGDEIGKAGPASIPDANAPMLAAQCQSHGIEVAACISIGDDPAILDVALRSAIDEHKPDVVITSGGISHGRFEVVRQLLEPLGGWFGHVAQQPGGPQGLARFAGVPVVCLPGNPISTAVSFRLFLAPVIGEAEEPVLARTTRELAGLSGRDQFLRARLRQEGATLVVTPVGGASSHLLLQSTTADCVLKVPAGVELHPGDEVEVYRW